MGADASGFDRVGILESWGLGLKRVLVPYMSS